MRYEINPKPMTMTAKQVTLMLIELSDLLKKDSIPHFADHIGGWHWTALYAPAHERARIVEIIDSVGIPAKVTLSGKILTISALC